MIDLRLPGNLANCIRLQPAAFNEGAYKVEPNVTFKDEKGILNTKKCALTNFIRWRYAKDASKSANKKASGGSSEEQEKNRLEAQVGLELQAEAPKVSGSTHIADFAPE